MPRLSLSPFSQLQIRLTTTRESQRSKPGVGGGGGGCGGGGGGGSGGCGGGSSDGGRGDSSAAGRKKTRDGEGALFWRLEFSKQEEKWEAFAARVTAFPTASAAAAATASPPVLISSLLNCASLKSPSQPQRL